MHGMDGSAAGGLLAGVAAEHLPALIAPLFLPVAIWPALAWLRHHAGSGSARAQRFLAGLEAAGLATRTAVVLMLVTASIHLGLIPAHLQEEPGTAFLFLVNAALFVLVSYRAVMVPGGAPHWRREAALLLGLTIVAYVVYVAGGREVPDNLGIGTKLVELTALGLVLLPSRASAPRGSWPRWIAAAAAVIFAAGLTGTISWAAEFRPNPADRITAAGQFITDAVVVPHRHHEPGMVMQSDPDAPVTPEQRAAAVKLAADTKAGIAKYEDVAVALADGYKPSTTPGGQTVHYMNQRYVHDGRTLDPTRPEVLVYANTAHGRVLLGAMYMMPKLGMKGPEPGGSLTDWHVHTNICFGAGARLAGLLSPFGSCPAGSLNVPTPAMLHVWTVPNPTGAFGDLDPAWLKRLTAR
jgi:hypothetical protein